MIFFLSRPKAWMSSVNSSQFVSLPQHLSTGDRFALPVRLVLHILTGSVCYRFCLVFQKVAKTARTRHASPAPSGRKAKFWLEFQTRSSKSKLNIRLKKENRRKSSWKAFFIIFCTPHYNSCTASVILYDANVFIWPLEMSHFVSLWVTAKNLRSRNEQNEKKEKLKKKPLAAMGSWTYRTCVIDCEFLKTRKRCVAFLSSCLFVFFSSPPPPLSCTWSLSASAFQFGLAPPPSTSPFPWAPSSTPPPTLTLALTSWKPPPKPRHPLHSGVSTYCC